MQMERFLAECGNSDIVFDPFLPIDSISTALHAPRGVLCLATVGVGC